MNGKTRMLLFISHELSICIIRGDRNGGYRHLKKQPALRFLKCRLLFIFSATSLLGYCYHRLFAGHLALRPFCYCAVRRNKCAFHRKSPSAHHIGPILFKIRHQFLIIQIVRFHGSACHIVREIKHLRQNWRC